MIRSAALLGLGAIGSTMAPGLYRILGDNGFCVIASGKRKEKLKREGIWINGSHYRFPVEDTDESHPVDVILVAVKNRQLEQAVSDIGSHVGANTCILSLMNGVKSEEIFASRYGKKRVLYSLTTISSQKEGNVVHYCMDAGKVRFGEEENRVLSPRVRDIKDLLDKAGIPCEVPENMIEALWQKYLFNISNNAVAAVLHARHFYFQHLESANHARQIVLLEAAEVARARGIRVSQEMIDSCMDYGDSYPPEGCCSMVQDIEAGRPTEKDVFLGDLISMADEVHVDVPVCRFLNTLIQTMEDAAAAGRREHLKN